MEKHTIGMTFLRKAMKHVENAFQAFQKSNLKMLSTGDLEDLLQQIEDKLKTEIMDLLDDLLARDRL